MDNSCTVSFPGIHQITSCSIGTTLGITPAKIVLTFPAQAATIIPDVGNLYLRYNSSPPVEILYKGCMVDGANYRYDASGQLTSMTIKDFRWKWQFGQVSGAFNVKDSDGEPKVIGGASEAVYSGGGVWLGDILKNSKASVPTLAILCLEQMGYDFTTATSMVAGLKDNSTVSVIYPTVDWDYENPAKALKSLLDPMNYAIAANPDGSADIVRLGWGKTLPDGQIESIAQTVDPTDLPEKIVIVCAPTIYQSDFSVDSAPFNLYRVGIDVNGGEIKDIDNLSYAPKDWDEYADSYNFSDLGTEEEIRAAKKSVFRWYKLPETDVHVDVGNLPPPPAGRIVWRSDLADKYVVEGKKVNRTPFAFAAKAYLKSDDYEPWVVIVDPTSFYKNDHMLPIGVSIGNGGIAKLNSPVTLSESEAKMPQEFGVRASFHMKSKERNGQLERHEYEHRIIYPKPDSNIVGSGTMYIERNDLVRVLNYTGSHLDTPAGAPQDNLKEVDEECSNYAYAIVDSFNWYWLNRPETATYGGIVNIPLDGSIRTINYSWNESGARTIISYNSDFGGPLTLSKKQRDRKEALDELASIFGEPIGSKSISYGGEGVGLIID